MNSTGGGDPNRIPPQGGPFWDNYTDRRLDTVTVRLKELADQLSETAKELRVLVRTSDKQANELDRIDERLRTAERELDEVPKRLEKLAPFDWAQRMDTRISSIEDENKSPFVRKLEFEPVKRAVFTLIGAICLAVLAAVGRLVMK